MTETTWGQIAYEAYRVSCGENLPSWAPMPADIRQWWEAAALAVIREYRLAKEET